MVKGAKKRGFPVIMIVTDLPDYQFDGGKTAEKYNQLLDKADGYIFLTEQMNEKVNKQNKPYIVLEGHADYALPTIRQSEKYENDTGKKVVVYAGSIAKLYGIQNLVQGFILADIPNTELHIFGDGDYREELEEIAKTSDNVKYMGVRPNSEIVYAEQRASLLVNPRPSEPEYTKYSFPSKTMEYMVSGTPVLTTKLPGIPKEYYPYVYTIDKETADGIGEKLKEIFALPVMLRNEKGEKAREFVLENKSNVVQARKILNFLEENY